MVSMSVPSKIDPMTVIGLVTILIGAWDLMASLTSAVSDPYVTDQMRFRETAGCAFVLIAGFVATAAYRLDLVRRTALASSFIGVGFLVRYSLLPDFYILDAVLAFAIFGSVFAILIIAFSATILIKRGTDLSVILMMMVMISAMDVLSVVTCLFLKTEWPFTLTFAHGAIPLAVPLILMICVLRKNGIRTMPRTESGDADLMTVLAISMMIVGLTNVLYVLSLNNDLSDIYIVSLLTLMSGITMTVGGLFVLFSDRYRFWARASFAGLFFGIATLFTCSDITSDHSELLGFVTSIVALIAGVASIVAAVSMIFGYRHYASRLFQIFCVMIIVQVVPIYQCYYYGISPSLSISLVYPQIACIAAYAVMLVVLHDESVRVVPVTERVDSSFGIIKNTMYSDEDDYILPEDLESIERFIASDSCEALHVPIQGKGGSEIVMSRSSDGTVFGTMLPTVGKTFLDGFRFEVRTLVRSADGVIRIYGKEGAFVQILVHPVPPKRTMKDRLLIFPEKTTESDE